LFRHGLALAVSTALVGVPGAFAQGPEVEAGADPYAPLDEPPIVGWEQLLAAPRIGDRLMTVAVDPGNADRIFVGTGEGTVVRSTDGGITWEESPVSPFNVLGRSVAGTGIRLRAGRALDIGDDPTEIEIVTGVPQLDASARSRDGARTPRAQTVAQGANASVALLQEAIASREGETVGINRIRVCPGARYPLLVSTSREVYGSNDDGRTFVRLFNGASTAAFTGAGGAQVTSVACSPVDANDIVVGTARGSVRSTDGGLTFTDDVRGTTAGLTTALAWDFASDTGGTPALLVAMGTFLFVGDPDSEGGLSFIYPDHSNPGLAPFLGINSVTTTPSAQIWLGTDDGVRASLDGGVSWIRPGGTLFAGIPIGQVVTGFGRAGHERMAIVTDRIVYSSDDSGATLHPFFARMSRRTVRHVASAGLDPNGDGAWFVLTTGELWRTVTEEPPPAFDTTAIRENAQRALERTPRLQDVLETVFERQEITADDIETVFDGASDRELVPTVSFEFLWGTNVLDFTSVRSPSAFTIDRNSEVLGWALVGTLTWSFPDYWWPQAFDWPKAELYELQKQVGFVVEDAWHERRMHLTRLARDGVVEELQARILEARVEVLEALLETWIGAPIDSVGRRF
jgi:hypothetical protein